MDPKHQASLSSTKQGSRRATVEIREAIGPAMIDQARTLMIEYRDTISTPLCFQNFDDEMAALPGKYARPDGAIFIAFVADESGQQVPVGCIAIRPLSVDSRGRICELKRMYVRQSSRGHGVGRALCEHALSQAKAMGYVCMRLDTDSYMKPAQALYVSLGFRPIEKYNDDPIPDTLFFEVGL